LSDTEIHFDTCDCRILYPSYKLLKKCKIHNNAREAHAHNQSFNRRLGIGTKPNEAQRMQNIAEKRAERLRIRAL